VNGANQHPVVPTVLSEAVVLDGFLGCLAVQWIKERIGDDERNP
jgi:hypothetical protein